MSCAMNIWIDLIVTGLATLTGILFGVGVGLVLERRRNSGVMGTLPSLRWDGNEVWGDFTSLEAVRKTVRPPGAGGTDGR